MNIQQINKMKKEGTFKVSELDYDYNLVCVTRGMPEAELAFAELCDGAYIALSSDGSVACAYFDKRLTELATSLTGEYYLDNFRFVES